MREIVVSGGAAIIAHVLRRNADGSWPDAPLTVEDGDLVLASIDFRAPLAAIHRTTRLAG